MSILQYGFMQRAFLVGILLAVITPCIGNTIVLKRMSMIGDALSHSSLMDTILPNKKLFRLAPFSTKPDSTPASPIPADMTMEIATSE